MKRRVGRVGRKGRQDDQLQSLELRKYELLQELEVLEEELETDARERLVQTLTIRYLISTIDEEKQDLLEEEGHLPKIAEYFFYFFLDAKTCDAIVGDLEERYKLIFKKFGHRRAALWYWKEALSSTGPIMWAWAKKIVMKPGLAVISWMAANRFLPLDSWLVMLVDLVKKIRS